MNVESALLLTQAFVPGMRDRGFGRVIFIVSNSYWRPPGAHMLAYIASKGALIGMARTLAVGVPAKVKRELRMDEIARLEQSWRNYVEYKEKYLSQ